jgi:ribosomal protein S18 acetylase RimI-like enzyme
VTDVRIRPAELGRDGEAVLAVQRAGYALEARLAGVDALPPQHQTTDDLRGEEVWVAEVGGKVVGVLGIEDGSEVLIARLVVDPALMGRGIGRALARHALALAGRRSVRVGTAAANAPALALYASLGFEPAGERTVGDGLAYVDLVRPGP